MRKILSIGLLILIFIPLPIGLHGRTGLYNTASGLYWCADNYSCLHEQAHYIDWHNGMISHSAEYKQALIIYIKTNGELSVELMNLMGWNIEEIYAWLYAESGGNVPEVFKSFYPPLPEFDSIPVWNGNIFYVIHNSKN